MLSVTGTNKAKPGLLSVRDGVQWIPILDGKLNELFFPEGDPGELDITKLCSTICMLLLR